MVSAGFLEPAEFPHTFRRVSDEESARPNAILIIVPYAKWFKFRTDSPTPRTTDRFPKCFRAVSGKRRVFAHAPKSSRRASGPTQCNSNIAPWGEISKFKNEYGHRGQLQGFHSAPPMFPPDGFMCSFRRAPLRNGADPMPFLESVIVMKYSNSS